ncbi:hypothetical protein [Pseudomonas ogarae]
MIAAVNCEPLCKRIGREGAQVVLRSENPRYLRDFKKFVEL